MSVQRTSELLYSLGVGRQYIGHGIVIQAVELVLRDEKALHCVKRGVFEPLGASCGCDWRAIERNIRTVIHRAWKRNAAVLTSLAVSPVHGEPTVTEFLDMLAVRSGRR